MKYHMYVRHTRGSNDIVIKIKFVTATMAILILGTVPSAYAHSAAYIYGLHMGLKEIGLIV
jgi:hypothetical protein